MWAEEGHELVNEPEGSSGLGNGAVEVCGWSRLAKNPVRRRGKSNHAVIIINVLIVLVAVQGNGA
jgi:hypothetical protein